MEKKAFYQSFAKTVSWGVIAVSISFWMNLLTQEAFPERWNLLLVAPVMEEIAKYLGLRRTRSILIPIIFIIGESIVQVSNYPPPLRDVVEIWLFYVPFSIIALRHLLFYAFVYLCNFRLVGLLLAIGVHSLWNWHAITDQDTVQMSLLTLLVVIVPILALYKWDKDE